MKSLFILTIALILCFFTLPVQGLAAIEYLFTHDRPLLTLERLQSQLKAPIPSEGSNLIDLRKFTLDLCSENAEFVDFFYTSLHNALREAQFSRPVNLRSAVILDRADFSYSSFGKEAYLNVPGLRFDSDRAKIVGDPGRIGKVISVPTLEGNETLLRELIRNFRRMDQISDANQIDYMGQKLRSKELLRRVFGVNLNTANLQQLTRLGLSPTRAKAVRVRNLAQPMKTLTELLSVGEIDLATHTHVRDRVITVEALPIAVEVVSRVGLLISWVGVEAALVWRLYTEGRYHSKLDVSYFVEEGTLRQVRLLIGRLPIMNSDFIYLCRMLLG
ncbi:MAG: helix-hairpin-helix domain-containing protein [Alkalinema sp. FL-bin-369]|nr:helix-hairpin-helix domain-containing protein [Leptolyngbyaceae cyanobacterium LF-bin-369]